LIYALTVTIADPERFEAAYNDMKKCYEELCQVSHQTSAYMGAEGITASVLLGWEGQYEFFDWLQVDNEWKVAANMVYKPDGTYELQVPMTVKHQAVWLIVNPIYSDKVVLAAGKTVEVDFDFTQIYRPWELPDNELTPYFAGENVDLNYAINLPFLRNFMTELVYNDESRKKVANFTMPQFKEYILDGYNDYVKRIDTMHVTKRAKEFLKLMLKYQSAEILARAVIYLPSWREEYGVACHNPQW
jgi:hypothetical protein